MIKGWLTITSLKNGKIVKMFHKHGNRVLTMATDENERDILVEKCGKEWIPAVIDFNVLFDADCMVTEDYDLTFGEALREMLDGKIVASEHMPNRVFKFDKKFYWASNYDTNRSWNTWATYSTPEQEGMWRVVE